LASALNVSRCASKRRFDVRADAKADPSDNITADQWDTSADPVQEQHAGDLAEDPEHIVDAVDQECVLRKADRRVDLAVCQL
jgi:hypothetical protein